jgi:HEPN domain-containing protein
VKRRDLQELASTRLKDAQILFHNRRFDGAYYLAGYAVECAIKACVARKTQRYDFPDKELAVQVYTHDLTKLLKPAGIAQVWEQELRADRALELKWGVVKDWTEQSRYSTHSRQKAKDMLEAVEGSQGILECLKKYW